MQKDLLAGVLACDLVGFHTDEYRRNFAECCVRGLKVKVNRVDIEYQGHMAHLGTFTVGIDLPKFENGLKHKDIWKRIKELEEEYQHKIVILSVDQLDCTRVLCRNFRDINTSSCSTWISCEDVKEYQDLERELNMIIGKINSEHSTPEEAPILYLHHSAPFTDLMALYRIADICLITSRRDSMNLVATKYVACQKDRYGVLVLSEIAGATASTGAGSIAFNPSSAQQISDSIYKATGMSLEEKKKKFLQLEELVTTNTSERWGVSFIEALSAYAWLRIILDLIWKL